MRASHALAAVASGLVAPALVAAALGLAGCSEPRPVEPPAPSPPAVVPVTVYLVRHGESWKNVKHPAEMKDEDVDRLTPRGREQAEEAGRVLLARIAAPRERLRILSSPLGRTTETATIVRGMLFPPRRGGGAKGVEENVIVLPRLALFADGESVEDGQRRAAAEIEDFISSTAGISVLVVVTHGDVIAALLGKAAGTPLDRSAAMHEVSTGTVSEVEVSPERKWTLVRQAGAAPPAK